MKFIVGLGNPGEKFKNTRHNVGFMVVDAIAKKLVISNWKLGKKLETEIIETKEFVLAKPQTFMNNSGSAVKKLITNYLPRQRAGKLPMTDLYVIHDDLDIPLGQYKIQFGKGPKVHNGLRSIEQHLKTAGFWRVRVGIAGDHYQEIKASGQSMAENYVLKPFTAKEKIEIEKVIEKAAEELTSILRII